MSDQYVTRDTPATPEPEQQQTAGEPAASADQPPKVPASPASDNEDSCAIKDRRKPSEAMQQRIVDAARLRAEGNTWQQIADRYRYESAESARSTIQGDYAATWHACWGWAREHLRPVYEAEAVATLRELTQPCKPVYGKDGKPKEEDGGVVHEERKEGVRESAAHALLAHVRGLQAQDINLQLRGNVGRHTTDLDELADDDLDDILAAAVAAKAARTEGA